MMAWCPKIYIESPKLLKDTDKAYVRGAALNVFKQNIPKRNQQVENQKASRKIPIVTRLTTKNASIASLHVPYLVIAKTTAITIL